MTTAPDFLAHDVDLTRCSSFRTPARAEYFYTVRDESDLGRLPAIYQFATEGDLPILWLGGGTNMLFAFDTFHGLVIKNELRWVTYSGNTITAMSGELISPLSLQISKSYENSLYGKWVGLPGTVGGAVAGNAGCFGFEMGHAFMQCRAMNIQTEDIHILTPTDLDFSYRHSSLRQHPEWFLIDATMRCDLISDDTTDPRTFRSSKQPSGFTCGSFFKNPVGDSAGRLIDTAGLKGARIGGALISDIHANFFMHDGNGSHHDILALRDLAKAKIKELYGIELLEEVRIVEGR